MVGNNALTLNQATITKAIQYWLENEVFQGDVPTVGSVSFNAMSDTFEVRLESK